MTILLLWVFGRFFGHFPHCACYRRKLQVTMIIRSSLWRSPNDFFYFDRDFQKKLDMIMKNTAKNVEILRFFLTGISKLSNNSVPFEQTFWNFATFRTSLLRTTKISSRLTQRKVVTIRCSQCFLTFLKKTVNDGSNEFLYVFLANRQTHFRPVFDHFDVFISNKHKLKREKNKTGIKKCHNSATSSPQFRHNTAMSYR